MQKLESIKLFRDLQDVPSKYKSLELRNNTTEVEANKKLQELILTYKSQLQQIKERSNFISRQIREQAQSHSSKNIYTTIVQLNSLAKDKCDYIKSSDMEFEHTCVKAVLLSTVDELSLVNDSIRNKEFINDKHTYFYIYEKVVINCFMNFLALKDMGIQISKIEALSQAVLSQIQTLSLISI